jgi:hypothetical protein
MTRPEAYALALAIIQNVLDSDTYDQADYLAATEAVAIIKADMARESMQLPLTVDSGPRPAPDGYTGRPRLNLNKD